MAQQTARLAASGAAAVGCLLGLLCLGLHIQASWISLNPNAWTPASTGGLHEWKRAHLGFFTRRNSGGKGEYIYPRAPPDGFDKWVEFAKAHKCILGSYEGIEKDLAPFRELPGGITQEMLDKAKAMKNMINISIKNGTLNYTILTEFNNPGFAINRIEKMMSSFIGSLPDMELVVSEVDEPRVLPGEVDDLETRYSSQQCANASEDFRERRQFHGFIVSPMYYYYGPPSKELLPVFSQSKIDNCYSDITFPTWFNWDYKLSQEAKKSLVPWDERNETLFFRGGPTGGLYHQDSDFESSHRHRLMSLAKGSPHMDMMFTEPWGCISADVCQRMAEKYSFGDWKKEEEIFKYKYLIAVDGMTFISRLPIYLESGSLVFRAGIFSEWYDEHLKPYEHYIPVKIDFSDLEEKLQWAIEHDDEAARIAARGQEVASTKLRNEDQMCYLYRLLLEYNMLVK